MLRAAYGLDAPPASPEAWIDLRTYQTIVTLLDELEAWVELGSELSTEELAASLERAQVRLGPVRSGHVTVLDLLRARTRRAEVVFVLGLEEGVFPQRAPGSPFLDDERRRELGDGARLAKPDPVSRARYLFYTACTRPSRRLYLVREAATDDGAPRQPSPFWEDVRAVLRPDDLPRVTRRRALSELVWPLEGAPSERERLRAVSWLSTTDRSGAEGIALANGWERRLARAFDAFRRPTRLTDPAVLESLASRTMFGVTELEAFAGCSSIWFVERMLDPKSMDAEVDPRMRGSIAHQTLFKFFSGLPKRLGCEQVSPEQLDDALAFLSECLTEAIAGGAENRLELTDLQRSELRETLWRDLEALVRAEAESELPLVPRKFEVSFGSERSAPELQRGLDLETFRLSGKIDRVDLDPFSARGIVWDYKSGKKAHSAAEIERELRLQIPLYMLVLRDLVGVEPLGGLYRPLSGDRKARGLLRASARADGVPGYSARDYVDEEDFWGKVDRAQEVARRMVARIREGDVRHDPREGSCPSWCKLGSMCRVRQGVAMAATAERPPTPEQHAAIQAEGLVFVSAGAGTGKTAVLVERFVRGIESGVDVGSILVITYTERAAAELRSRIRTRLAELGRRELTRELDGAWISTIHGFCLRLLKQHPFAAGLDPRFRVLDESQAAVLRAEAFDEALAEFCADEQPDRLALLATYGSAALRRMLTSVYADASRCRPGPGAADRRCARNRRGRGACRRLRRRRRRGRPARRAARPTAAARGAARPLRLHGQGRRRLRAGAPGARAGGVERRRRTGPRAARASAPVVRALLPGGQGPGVCARLRRPAAPRAKPAS